jgi:hypothetical protein
MKHLYKSTKVIFNSHRKEYQVFYKNWLFWKYDSCYKYDDTDDKSYKLLPPIHYCDKDTAKKRAITRAENMLETVEVWRRSVIYYE